MIRDRYVGVDMAQILSLVMGIFIIVPVVAPLIGQTLLLIMPWRGMFILLGIFCGLGVPGFYYANRKLYSGQHRYRRFK